MAIYRSSGGALQIEGAPEQFLQRFTRKETRHSCFHAEDNLELLIQLTGTSKLEVRIIGTMITENHNNVSATFCFTPGDQGTKLDFDFEFEKLKNNIEDTNLVESLLTHIRLKARCYRNHTSLRSIDLPSPPDVCFERFDESLRNSNLFHMLAADFEKRTIKMDFRNYGYGVVADFYAVIVTVKFTPRGNGYCRLKWTLDPHKKVSGSFYDIALFVRQTIEARIATINWALRK